MLNTQKKSTTPRIHAAPKADEELLFHEPERITRRALGNEAPAWLSTKKALIYCYNCEDFCRHDFQSRQEVSARGVPLYAELLYACHRCGKARVWGTEEPQAR